MVGPRTFEVLVIGGGPAGAAAGVLAGPPRARRGRGRAQDVSAGEDLRRRADAEGRQAAPGHGPGRGADEVPPLRRTALHRAGPITGAALARAPGVPVVRLRGAPAGPRLDGGAERGGGRSHLVAGHRGHRAGDRSRLRAGGRGRVGRRHLAPIELRARYVVVADGANSRFGRALGTFRTKEWPYGTAIRSYWESPRHDEPWIESALDVEDRNGNPLPGYGWIFPVGDGTVNIGVGLLSTFRDFKSVNTTHLLDSYAAHGRRPLGDRRRPPHAPVRSAGASPWEVRWGRSRARRTSSSATPPVGQPVQRRGHRLRLRDRPTWRPTTLHQALVERRPLAAGRLPAAARRPSTASTSRWPACSPASSGARR